MEIVTGDIEVVYVRTEAGKIYGCKHGGREKAKDCWVEDHEPLRVDSKARFDKMLYQGEIDPPIGTVLDTLDVTVWYAEDAYETHYVLLEDGTVWKWEYDVGFYLGFFIIILGPIAGLAIGLVVVVIMWAIESIRRFRNVKVQRTLQN